MKKILLVFGTRPEAIKMIPIYKKFKNSTLFDVKLCITAQHREMLDEVLNIFDVKADYDLNIMKKNQSLTKLSSRLLESLDKVLKNRFDLVFVHGDTTTSFFGALASYYHKIDVAHIEAGLRTNNIYSPYPEELNRQLTSKIAKYHFAPTIEAKNNLLKENINKNIFVVGNSVVDALFLALKKIKNNLKLEKQILEKIGYKFSNKKIVLITGHRRENFGKGFFKICKSIKKLAKKYPNIDFVYPVHLNPNVQKPVFEILSNLKNVYLLKPLDYLSFVYLMDKSYLILTDSGGIQEEAPSLGKPVLVMRENTERPEALEAGTIKLVGTTKIEKEISNLLDNKKEYKKMAKAINPYGDGKTSDKIFEIMGSNL
jgi:UDP-N-acetylglucosamine 2-epimerase (non-hydrolysing)